MTALIDGAEWRRAMGELYNEFERAVGDALEAGVEATVSHASNTRLYNDRTRRLRSSTRGKVDRSRLTAKVENRAPYASYIEHGRGPVRPKRAKFLRFQIAGRWVFSKGVGPSAPRPFLRLAGEHGTDVIYADFESRFGSAIRSLGFTPLLTT